MKPFLTFCFVQLLAFSATRAAEGKGLSASFPGLLCKSITLISLLQSKISYTSKTPSDPHLTSNKAGSLGQADHDPAGAKSGL